MTGRGNCRVNEAAYLLRPVTDVLSGNQTTRVNTPATFVAIHAQYVL